MRSFMDVDLKDVYGPSVIAKSLFLNSIGVFLNTQGNIQSDKKEFYATLASS